MTLTLVWILLMGQRHSRETLLIGKSLNKSSEHLCLPGCIKWIPAPYWWLMWLLDQPECYLRTFVQKFSNVDFFSETLTSIRWWFSFVKNVKKLGGHRLHFAENMLGRAPQIRKNRASLAKKASVCKPQNIAIKSLKWNVLCQILFKWTY